ncbi:uncharacterized protein LOC124280675 [Haliotis rubra]|uniref:uncharacterized protein LOC124280675 n=1 Tax=Haliotis rubra TaxID=36100 RepID=UPI001EE63031|nr:uncharacterized protein LOC124280675 [Haliotis rubra]
MATCSAETEGNSQTLIDSPGIPWNQWPKKKKKIAGIYVIKQDGLVIYVGRSKDIEQRLKSHCYGKVQAIDEHIADTAPKWLSYNYVIDPDQKCNEHCYIDHITQLQRGQRPEFNRTRGDACTHCQRRKPGDKDTECAIL